MGTAHRLDRLEIFRRLDPSDMMGLVQALPDHGEEARRAVKRSPPRLRAAGIRRVVVAGLGGSAIAGDVLRDVVGRTSPIDFQVRRHYRLDGSVGRDSLVVASSYSGNTEETLAIYAEARRRGARLLAVTGGGALGRLARRHRVPVCPLPGGLPPRAAFGHSFFTLLTALESTGLLPSLEADCREAFRILRMTARACALVVPFRKNPAKRLAAFLHGRLPAVYAGTDHLEGAGLRWRGQLNENAKQLVLFHVLPEMNHNEIVGYTRRDAGTRRVAAVLLRHPAGDHPQVSRRFDFLRRLLAARAGGVREVRGRGRSRLAQVLSVVYPGDFVSVYLAYLKGVDPTPVEVIDRLKRSLSRKN